jgi:hypothetical protein
MNWMNGRMERLVSTYEARIGCGGLMREAAELRETIVVER